MWMAIAIILARVIPAYGRVLALTETALSFLDAVLTVLLLSCSVLIAGKFIPSC